MVGLEIPSKRIYSSQATLHCFCTNRPLSPPLLCAPEELSQACASPHEMLLVVLSIC